MGRLNLRVLESLKQKEKQKSVFGCFYQAMLQSFLTLARHAIHILYFKYSEMQTNKMPSAYPSNLVKPKT